MIEQLLSKVNAPDPLQAIGGWHEVRRNSDKLRTLSHRQFQTLIAAAEHASNADVFRHATVALLQLIEARRHAQSVPAAVAAPSTPVVDWLWQPFRQPAIVFSTACPGAPSQDEAPEFFVGRFLHRERSPKLRLIQLVDEEHALWKQIASDRTCKAVCILGCGGLSEDDVGRLVGNRIPRFRIVPVAHRADPCVPDVRSAAMNPAAPDSAAGRRSKGDHYVVETRGPGRVLEYRPQHTSKQRTDFALVERYRVVLGGRPVAVVRCAGCTRLGALAAARWACEELAEPASYRHPHPILLPKGTSDTSQLSALIQVTASPTPHPWEPKRLEVRKLFIDNWAWDAEEESWNPLPVEQVTLVRRGGQALRFLFDGCLVNTRRDSEAFSLLAALVEAKERTGSSALERAPLAKKLGCSQKELSRQLSLLKCRRLHDALEIDDDAVTLRAATCVVDEHGMESPAPNRPR